jgi:lysozyme
MNNLKIKLYKKKEIALLRKYKRLIIFLSVICLLLTINLVVSFCNKYIFPSIYAAKSIELSEETDKKESVVASSDSLVDSLATAEKNSKKNTGGLKNINGFAEQQKIIIQNKTPSEIKHIVEKGQTLYAISKMYNVNISAIKKLNKLKGTTINLHDSLIIRSNKVEKQTQLFVYGIDISHHQGKQIESINKQKDGIDFIICKATEGITYTDPEFSSNWKITKNKSILRGAYHFYRSKDDPIEQATHFLKTVSDFQSTDIPPILDFEEGGIDKSQSIGEIQSALKKFLLEIENKSKSKPIIYTDVTTGNTYLNDSFFAAYPLWIANYNGKEAPDLPIPWISKGWVFWQKTDKYMIDVKAYDFDKFNGNLLELKAFIKNSYNTK